MKKILVVVDMQNDFIDGALGTKEASAVVPRVISKIHGYSQDCIYATRDTHQEDYLETQEGQNLPVRHCIEGTKGWEIRREIADAMPGAVIINKPTFGSVILAQELMERNQREKVEVELVGLCTDICVISNALLIKALLPEVRISVDPKCCAGVTPQSHEAALEAMKSCQIQML
ncbi:MAG: cysteine hydrolase [Butyrivibrio sp.]|jgi:nicotinamidase-related amidase|nr:cysteine hydrolase [Butyrivibrio sp.]